MIHRRAEGARPSRRAVLAGAASAGVALPALAGMGEARVTLTTTLGEIVVAADTGRAPITAGDFLEYVDLGLFDDAAFYRTVRPDNDINPVKIEVIQGGVTAEKRFRPPIAHEPTNVTGLRHLDGTLSAGRNKPGSGSAGAFFICIGDQPELDFGGRRNPDRQGFAAFGRVLIGMDVVHAIWKLKTEGPSDSQNAQMIAPPVPILSAVRSTRPPG